MAENRYIFTFTIQKDKSQFSKVANKIESAYRRAKIKLIETGGGRCRKTGVYTLDVWPSDDVEHLGLKNALTYLHTLPSEDFPFVRVEFDQTQEPFFYILLDGKLTGFDSETELNDYLSKHGKPSVEKYFYDEFGKGKSTLFLKISFKKKSDIKELYTASTQYINEKSEDNLLSIKTAVDNLYSSHNPSCQTKYGFPNHVEYDQKHPGNLEKVGCLCFSVIENKHLYLGFEFNGDLVMEYSPRDFLIGGGSHENVACKEGHEIVSFVQSLYTSRCYQNLKGKFTDFNSTDTKKAGYFFTMDDGFFMFAPCELMPSQIWPS